LGSFGHGLSAGEVARVEVRTVLRATDAGTYAIAGSGVGRYALSVGGELVFDGELELAPGADVVEGMMVPPQAVHRIQLDRGRAVEIVLTHEVKPRTGDVGDPATTFQLNLRPPHASDDEEIERAVARARAADVAIVVVGTTEEVESEGFDRASLSLPGRQDELVRRVADANPSTVVVVNAGAPVLLPWADQVAAVLIAWFPGQEFGNALADVLLGLVEPGGRLPTTWPSSADDLPSTRPVDGVLPYDEGLFVGYRGYGRRRPAPLYPFGHGLGYTTWRYDSIEVPEHIAPGADVAVAVRVRNTGTRRGREVVQLYASRPDGSVERPIRWLVGFAGVEAEAGEDVTATVLVRARALEHWDVQEGRWRVERGTFGLAAGGSCAVLTVSAEVTILRGT
jgi:beta-glucosidase